ncbi:MAG: hypothetical protein WCB27_07665 [Thermoguttaceae bacterium]
MRVLSLCLLLLIAAACPMGFVLADDASSLPNQATKTATVEERPGLALSSDCVGTPSCVQEPACCDSVCPAAQCCERVWTIDYRVKTLFDSNTTYQFGQPDNSYAPLSKLSWPLDSTWDGLQIGVEKPNWRAHFEWLAPMVHDTYRDQADYDWSGPNRDPASLSSSPERWTDGQMVELEGSFKLTDHLLGTPLEVWPVIGFRFQRFDLMAHDGDQIINDGTLNPLPPPVGYHWVGDMGSFNQQYYMGYIGAQLRRDCNVGNCRRVTFVLQADWADTWGYNIDHHISGYEDSGVHRYTMDTTQGGAFHLALTAETPISCRFFLGLEVEHLEIRTWGSHHYVETGAQQVDQTWTNGVSATSDQTSLTAYLRARY